MKREHMVELVELREAIKESIWQVKLKGFQGLLQRYFPIFKAKLVVDNTNRDYRFYKHRIAK